ncbi:MAG: autotransporter outer membrane beta-barrel domain-containing protein [Pseudomonadota bacterium]
MAVTLVLAASPAPVSAQDCNTNPAPTAPPAKTLSDPSTTQGVNEDNNGTDGCDATGKSSRPGLPGQPAGDLDLSVENARVTGNQAGTVTAKGNGGAGGDGGESADPFLRSARGGPGGDGGAAGSVKLTFSGERDASSNRDDAGDISATAKGGPGGTGGKAQGSRGTRHGGRGGAGGAGGTATIDITGTIASQETTTGADASGGEGGRGRQTFKDTTSNTGGAGGTGGSGGVATGVFAGVITFQLNNGIRVVANGGDGGSGGAVGGGDVGEGGRGGDGGAAGDVEVTLTEGAKVTQTGEDSNTSGTAITAQANGGLGGFGGNEAAAFRGRGGNGGTGGDGGTVDVSIADTAEIDTSEPYFYGLLAQSVGGGGGDAGNARGSIFDAVGGKGRGGGNAGPVTLSYGTATAHTKGKGAHTLLLQSIGGGGGAGGDASTLVIGDDVQIAIGGNGGLGGDGGDVTVKSMDGTLTTEGDLATGLLAQSIGSAGGSGGDASSKTFIAFPFDIGGQAGDGGKSGTVTLTTAGSITTSGDHASGIMAQSIGGGGGKGGAAAARTTGVNGTISASVAVGGGGGSGGPGGDVDITSDTAINTTGANAVGITAQSIGGGGGHGGNAFAKATQSIPVNPEDTPGLAVAVAIGGKGGSGNSAGQVSLDNRNGVDTTGAGSTALLAQSIGGGGGSGGDSTATAHATGSGDFNVSMAVSVGGSGGSGGAGGAVTLDNQAFVQTQGAGAHGLHGQSIGGGGGSGGTGHATATAKPGKSYTFSSAVSVGGSGGRGGESNTVELTNIGTVDTAGVGAFALFAQSIGGGGGHGGGGVGQANIAKSQQLSESEDASGGDEEPKDLDITVTVGGSGGSGNNGDAVTISNRAFLSTKGVDAAAIVAQSLGGGGGVGGYADASSEVKTSDADDDEDPGGEVRNLALAMGVGGRGGSGGWGGTVTVHNIGTGAGPGNIDTTGALADGILAQSVGAGGGIGGGGSATSKISEDAAADDEPTNIDYSFAISVGGDTGSGGDGGHVKVTHDNATISTKGVAAFGVLAQSVGGGGGKGRGVGAVDGLLGGPILLRAVAGSDYETNDDDDRIPVTGDGGDVDITLSDNVKITTSGKHAIGILAQSIGAGGGTLYALKTDHVGAPSADPTSEEADEFEVDIRVGGGSGGASGNGGTVKVELDFGSSVSTSGRNGHGVVVQSIGGGGGLTVGGQATGTAFAESFDSVSDGKNKVGNGGKVTVDVSDRALISTSGDGAVGIWAQSIGSGGGIGGDTATTLDLAAEQFTLSRHSLRRRVSGEGNGGEIDIILEQASTVMTTGENAPAIFAQSLGAGGGHFTTQEGTVTGSVGRTWMTGTGGAVTVTLEDGSQVTATGQGSPGIYIQAQGASKSGALAAAGATITVRNSTVEGGPDAAAIRIEGGSDANYILNRGVIKSADGANGTAILGTEHIEVENYGTIVGNQVFPGTASIVRNRRSGLIESRRINVGRQGSVVNAGTIAIGGIDRIGTTRIIGDFRQTGSGQLAIDLDASAGNMDQIVVDGDMDLRGTAAILPRTLSRGALTLATAEGDIRVDPSFEIEATQLFSFETDIDDRDITLRPQADFAAADVPGNYADLAASIQDAWDTGAPDLGTVFAAMADIDNAAAYADTLQTLSNEAVSAISAARYNGSLRFVRNTYGCRRFADASPLYVETGCYWGRILRGSADYSGGDGNLGYDWNATTTAVGGQFPINQDWFLGGSIGFESSRLDADDDVADVDGDAVLVAANLTSRQGRWFVSGVADLGYGWYDSTRVIDLGGSRETATASPKAFNAGIHLRTAYQIPFQQWYLQPRLDLDATYLRLDGYTEKSASPLALSVDGSDGFIFSASPAVKLGRRVDMRDGGVFDVFAAAGVSFTGGNDWKTDARFVDAAGSSDFSTELDMPDVLGRIEAGVEVMTAGAFALTVQYEVEFGDDLFGQSGLLQAAWRF